MGIDWVLFDLGGVLVKLGGVRDFGDLIGESNSDRVWQEWLRNDWVRDYERGLCSRDAFARGMVEQFELDVSPDEFIERFLAWPCGLLPGAHELVETLASTVSVTCLSNTNELHWNHQMDAERVARLFPTPFLSHELGVIKPDRDIYDHVVARLGVAADSILFFDDNQLNVDGARAAGWQAERVVGPDAARACLESRGLLPA